MKTERLYYQDSEMKTFQASVISCEAYKDGYQIVLDRTAFYPEGGGQPGDRGVLDDVEVFDTKAVNGQIVHYCKNPLSPGKTVTGRIDDLRRFDYMQQHTGEHIVSGIIHRKFGYENVGFHMGAETVTIDLSGPLTMEDLRQVEREANEAVYRDLPVEIDFYTDETVGSLSYRSKKELSGEIRIVRIPDYDVCACCGTHVKTTGEIGLIKILSCQKFHDGTRAEMLCGRKAYEYLSKVFEQNRQNTALLSAKPLETSQSVRRMLEELAQVKFRLGQMEREIAAAQLRQHQGEKNPLVFVSLSPDAGRALADGLMKNTDGLCAVFNGTDRDGYQYIVCQKGGDLREFCKNLNQALCGRGGGKAEFVQGSVTATGAQIKKFFSEAVS